ncbi:TRAP transporter substrate-binding protein DctP [Roseovarius sp. CAU 1744]|uniref:TRAP transporter substrate-binding protein DctP n=1 Tax=Roseovarius sp. CAU 1744 TaxID=3140368 RepID=UPI00325AC6C2
MLRFTLWAIVVVLFGVLGTGASMAKERSLSLLSSFPENFAFTEAIGMEFIRRIEELSEGEISVSLSGPEVVPPFEGLEPAQAGLYDILFTHGAYHSGTTGVGLAIDGMATDPALRRSSGAMDYIDAHYQKLGMKFVSSPCAGTKGLRFYLRQEIDNSSKFSGLKIRGTEPYNVIIRELGGSPVLMSGGEIYSSMQKGIIDGAAFPVLGAKGYKWYEVASYYSEPKYGQTCFIILVNLDVWNSLDQDEQNLISKVGQDLEVETIPLVDRMVEEETSALRELGMKPTIFPAEVTDNLEALWSEGVWQVAVKKSGEDAQKLRDIARDAGLSN